ncbi:MAG TPA: protein kinase [Labilithrix sp.]|nr:protein kinase [Labilithrix sp.]
MVATQGPADALGLVGSTIDQVRFDACVDAGGFGLIYRGFHEGLGETVAIKCLRIASIQRTNEEIREALAGRFRDETKLLYRLSQGNLDIVRCISSGTLVAPRTKEYTPYMVLEWLDGCTLSAELRERRERHLGVRSLEQAVKLLDSAVGGIAYAHTHDVVHRDVKPGNLFLTRTREGVRMKVLDFGLAKILSDEAIGVRPSVETGVGVHFCSPSYGAPEQYTSQVGKIGPWTDVYSLCLVLYEIMIGDKVRPAGNLAEGLMKAIDPVTGSPSASDLGLKLPRAVEDLLKKALAQNPADRPHDAGVFWAMLKEAMSAPAGADYGATVADDGLGSAMQLVRDAAILRASARAKASPFAGTMLMRNAPTGAPHLVDPHLVAPVPAAGRPPTPAGAMPPVSRSTAPLSPPRQAANAGTMAMTVPFGAQSPLAASMAVQSPLQNAPSSGPPPAYAAGPSGPPPPDYAQQPQQQQPQPPQQQQQQQQQPPAQQLSSYPPEGSGRPGPRAGIATDPRMGLAPVSGTKKSSGGGLLALIAVGLLVLLGFSYYWLRVRGH